MSHDSIIQLPLEDIVGERFGRYSKYIIQERALPDVRDGLKPVQRRILYAMYHDKNHFDKAYRKSAKTVGLVIGNYHPHGDSSVYDAMVRMSQSWKYGMPLIDMQGNNGSIDDDPAAAMRYTEARLSKISHSLLENIYEETVPFVLNFDDTEQEPSVLPARFPNLLINGATGIAAGYATNIPPFNLKEIMDAAIHRLINPLSDVEDLMQFIQGPDFPTAGIIQGKDGIKDILSKGKGRVVVRAKTEIVETKTLKQIVITELPYEVIKSNVVKKIDDLRYTKATEGFGDVMDVRDESDRNGLRIVIDCKRDADAASILNLFFKQTELQVYYNANMVTIVNQRPKVCGVIEILDAYIAFRQEVVLNRSKYRYAQKEKRLHILEGLMKATSILDEIIAVIKASKNRADSRDNIMGEFGFSHEQASAIVDLQLYRLSSTDITALRDEFAKLVNEMDYLELIINNKDMLNNLMIKEFQEIRDTFEAPRRSKVEAEISDLEVDTMALIPNEQVMISVTKRGYIKRVSLRSYGSSQKDVIALGDDDAPILVNEVSTTDRLVLITSKGRYGLVLVYELEEAKWKDLGSHINQYVKMDPDETIIAAFTTSTFDTYQFVVTTSSKGLLKKTLLQDLFVKRNNKLYEIMKLGAGEKMVGAHVASHDDHVLMTTLNGQNIRLDLGDINPIGAKGKGIIGLKVKSGDLVVSSAILRHESEIIFVSEKGQLKRFKQHDIPLNNRATQGMSIVKLVKSNPHKLSKVLVGNIQDDITIYHESMGIVLIKDIPLMGADATFSSVVKESDYVIIDKPMKVLEISIPENRSQEKVEETLQLDFEL